MAIKNEIIQNQKNELLKEKKGGSVMAEVLFDCKDKPEADKLVTQILDNLTVDEQKEFLAFMQGIRFAKGLEKEKPDVMMQTA